MLGLTNRLHIKRERPGDGNETAEIGSTSRVVRETEMKGRVGETEREREKDRLRPEACVTHICWR